MLKSLTIGWSNFVPSARGQRLYLCYDLRAKTSLLHCCRLLSRRILQHTQRSDKLHFFLAQFLDTFSTYDSRRHALSCTQAQACPICPNGSRCQPSTQIPSTPNARLAVADQPDCSEYQTQPAWGFYTASAYLCICPEPQHQKHSQKESTNQLRWRQEAPIQRGTGCQMHHPCSGRLPRILRQNVQGRAAMGIEFGNTIERQHTYACC